MNGEKALSKPADAESTMASFFPRRRAAVDRACTFQGSAHQFISAKRGSYCACGRRADLKMYLSASPRDSSHTAHSCLPLTIRNSADCLFLRSSV